MHIVYNAHICVYLFLDKSLNVTQPGLELEISLSPSFVEKFTGMYYHLWSVSFNYRYILLQKILMSPSLFIAYNVGIC